VLVSQRRSSTLRYSKTQNYRRNRKVQSSHNSGNCRYYTEARFLRASEIFRLVSSERTLPFKGDGPCRFLCDCDIFSRTLSGRGRPFKTDGIPECETESFCLCPSESGIPFSFLKYDDFDIFARVSSEIPCPIKDALIFSRVSGVWDIPVRIAPPSPPMHLFKQSGFFKISSVMCERSSSLSSFRFAHFFRISNVCAFTPYFLIDKRMRKPEPR